MALLATVVRRALASIEDPSPKDQAAGALAVTYAKAIDEANVVAASLTKVLREVAELDQDTYDRLLPLAVRIERTHVLATLGPKLLATMDALLITPKARSALQKGVKDAGKRRNPLNELRARRAARVDNTPAVDPTTSGTDT